MTKLTIYSKTILWLHFISLLSLTMFFWGGWRIRIGSYMDLGFLREMVTVFGIVGVYLVWLKRSLPLPRIYGFLFVSLLAMMLYGAGMHQAANQIAVTDSSPIVSFYDEYFSHWLGWGSVLVINFLFGLVSEIQKLNNKEMWFIGLSGVVQGLISGLNILEARFGGVALAAGAIFLLVLWLQKSKDQRPLLLYFRSYFVSLVIFILIWVISNGFIEPSVIL